MDGKVGEVSVGDAMSARRGKVVGVRGIPWEGSSDVWSCVRVRTFAAAARNSARNYDVLATRLALAG